MYDWLDDKRQYNYQGGRGQLNFHYLVFNNKTVNKSSNRKSEIVLSFFLARTWNRIREIYVTQNLTVKCIKLFTQTYCLFVRSMSLCWFAGLPLKDNLYCCIYQLYFSCFYFSKEGSQKKLYIVNNSFINACTWNRFRKKNQLSGSS